MLKEVAALPMDTRDEGARVLPGRALGANGQWRGG
jgi:hypothetical protein